ncbi:proton channel OTOP1 [Electrophorus electricus]|uniref:Otopetrin 1 n=1 Tax=Electrophorus electricus TaxID=8005 RepID=A0A4W4H766_ELEEL|nr:proton channel OTOP1 [Electrophorus electricus]
MVEHNMLDVKFLNKYCASSSSSSSSSDREKKILSTLKGSLGKKYPQKNGEVLSAQYGINLLLIGVSLMLALSYQRPSVTEEILLAFLTALMLVQLLWMLCYIVRREQRRSLPPERDANTATSWIRGGLTMLAMLSLIMDAFRIGNFVGYQACVSPMLGVYPAVHALHTISQVHFLWFHIKDVIKRYETFERFGVIHAVFTNLLLWSNAVMTEAEHALNDHKKRLAALGYFNFTVDPEQPACNCTSSACSMFSSSLYYLCPFNIEYHIFVSALLFVMWKNIGRTLEHQSPEKHGSVGGSCLLLGPMLGLLALASSITVLVIYIIHVEETAEARASAISMFYTFGIVILACMSVAGAAGLLIYRVENWPMDTAANPARTLDAKLLLASSVGAWLLCWCSVVAVCWAQPSPTYRWSNLAYALLLVLEKCVQNLFIVESLYRRRREPDECSAHSPSHTPTHSPAPGEIFSVTVPIAPPYDGIVNHAYEMPDCRVMEKSQTNRHACSSNQRNMPLSLRHRTQDTPSWKRQVLKNIAIFLFMCNISLWVLPAFGCRPQFDNGLEEAVYGFSTWSTVLNFALPMSLCYRMHSVAALFEVFHKI